MTGWLIFALVIMIGLYARERNRTLALTQELDQIKGIAPPQSGAERSDDLRDDMELGDLRERIQVLERIAQQENSAEAREAQRIAAEIESLRENIQRRSSENKEDLSE